MKAPYCDQVKLLDLQPIDTELARLKHQQANPQTTAHIEKLRVEAKKVDRARIMANSADGQVRTKLQSIQTDIDQATNRLTVQEERLHSGKGSHREIVALDGEVKRLKNRLDELRAEKNKVSAALDDIANKIHKCEELTDKINEKIAQLEDEGASHSSELGKQVAELQSKRDELAADIDPQLLEEYERIRTITGGTGVAGMRQQYCPDLGFELSPAMWDRFQRADDDEVVTSDEYEYILVKIPEDR